MRTDGGQEGEDEAVPARTSSWPNLRLDRGGSTKPGFDHERVKGGGKDRRIAGGGEGETEEENCG